MAGNDDVTTEDLQRLLQDYNRRPGDAYSELAAPHQDLGPSLRPTPEPGFHDYANQWWKDLFNRGLTAAGHHNPGFAADQIVEGGKWFLPPVIGYQGYKHMSEGEPLKGALEIGAAALPFAGKAMGAAGAATERRVGDIAKRLEAGPWSNPEGVEAELASKNIAANRERFARPEDAKPEWSPRNFEDLNEEVNRRVRAAQASVLPPTTEGPAEDKILRTWYGGKGEGAGWFRGEGPWDWYQQVLPGGRKVTTEHPVPGILYDRENPTPRWRYANSEVGQDVRQMQARAHREGYGPEPPTTYDELAADLDAFARNQPVKTPAQQKLQDDIAAQARELRGLDAWDRYHRQPLLDESRAQDLAFGTERTRGLWTEGGHKWSWEGGPKEIGGYRLGDSWYIGDLNRLDREFPDRMNPLLVQGPNKSPRYIRDFAENRSEGTEPLDTYDMRHYTPRLQQILQERFGAPTERLPHGHTPEQRDAYFNAWRQAYDDFMADERQRMITGKPTEHDLEALAQWKLNRNYEKEKMGVADPEKARPEEIEEATEAHFGPRFARTAEARRRALEHLGLAGGKPEQPPLSDKLGTLGKWWTIGAAGTGLGILADRALSPGQEPPPGMTKRDMRYRKKTDSSTGP
jgi:hypothetical protein